MKKLKILANIARYDYGLKDRGSSFEYNTFFKYFESQGYQVDLFDYPKWEKKGGKDLVHRELFKMLKQKKYDLIFTVPLTDQFHLKTLEGLKKSNSGIVSMSWMCDDKWRWEKFGSKYGPYFDYTITTDPGAVEKYKSIGFENVILSQWAADTSKYKKLSFKKKYDVSFIGGNSGWRTYVIDRLENAGLKVSCFGWGWPNGKVSEKEMIEIYNQSKIVLNLSNSTRFDIGYLLQFQLPQKGSLKEMIASTFPGLTEFVLSSKRQEDIKARFFETLSTRAFLLSYPVENLDMYLEPGKHLVTYDSVSELIKKISYYLHHKEERALIANTGYEVVQKFHTYKNRFDEIFKEVGLL
jgi:spore maturation protein CgeB